MDKYKLLRMVNLILLLSFTVQCVTSIIIFFQIKTPIRPMIFEIHEYNGLLMIILAIMHIYLNWGWVKATFFSKQK